MTPEQKIKWIIIDRFYDGNISEMPDITKETVDEEFDALEDKESDSSGAYPYVCDVISEVREGEAETGLDTPLSQHYEAKAVAAQAPDGSWVGWTYWYGGGKYGEPEAVEWMDSAYDLDLHEEEKLVTVRTFTKMEAEKVIEQ
jgi:hypothetical protein